MRLSAASQHVGYTPIPPPVSSIAASPLQCSINKLTYTLPAYAGQLTADDENRINAISRKKAMRHGVTLSLTLTILLTSHQIANSFYRPLSQVTVCTIFSLPKPPPTVLISFGRGNIHTCFPLFSIRSLKTLTPIFVYLKMYNPLIVILCFYLLHFLT